jgi:ABC-type oligopeptide transport system substrate-binding subunit
VEAEGEAWATAATLITNGPFRLESWQSEQTLTLIRNSEYHGGLTGNIERVELSLLAECGAQLQRYESDELDIFDLGSLPPLERDSVRQAYAGEYVTGPSLGTMYVGFDVSRPPFDDVRVRQALILATEREYVAGVVMRGYYFPGTGGLIPPGMPGHSAEIGLPYDPDQARDALTKAGYPADRLLPPMDLLTFRSLKPHAEELVSNWQKTLNLEIKWQAVDYGEFVERMKQVPPCMFLSGWTADYPDPDNFLRVSPVQRYAQWQNRLYAELVETARQVGAQEERLRLYRQADRLLIQEAVVMPLVYMRRHLLVKPWIKKLPMSPIKHWFWKDAVIEAH